MEQFLNSLPKPVLALLVLFVGVLVFMLLEPPRTVCDTQVDSLKTTQAGVLFAQSLKKEGKIPPKIFAAKESCRLGNSAGSCFEYFGYIKAITQGVASAATECTGQMFEVKEVKSAILDATEIMARMAWGELPPDPGLTRFGWLTEAELNLFCRIKNVYTRAYGEAGWHELRKKIFAKLPGPLPSLAVAPTGGAALGSEPPRAVTVMSEQEIWDRSIFSVRCDLY